MENNEIMFNENVMEATEEVVTTNSGKGLKIAAEVGLAVVVGGLIYKYGIKPLVAKVKAKKGYTEVTPNDVVETEVENCEE